jgi:hypothetical protein
MQLSSGGATEQALSKSSGREAVRTHRLLRDVLSLVRVSNPPTPAERLLLAAVRLLKSPHAIMPQPCTMEEWRARYDRQREI